MTIKTVAELRAALEEYDGATPVALAVQAGWPFEHVLGQVEQAEDGTVYLAEGRQVAYLPGPAREALGW